MKCAQPITIHARKIQIRVGDFFSSHALDGIPPETFNLAYHSHHLSLPVKLLVHVIIHRWPAQMYFVNERSLFLETRSGIPFCESHRLRLLWLATKAN